MNPEREILILNTGGQPCTIYQHRTKNGNFLLIGVSSLEPYIVSSDGKYLYSTMYLDVERTTYPDELLQRLLDAEKED